MKVKKLSTEMLNVSDKNTAIELRRCDVCASGADCAQKGTFHGNIVPLWNETSLGKYLRERFGFAAQIPFVTGFYANLRLTHNVISNVGHAAGNGRISNQEGYSAFTNLALGIGAETAAALDQALSNEITANGGARGAATASQVTTSVTNDTMQLVKTWNFIASFAVTEEGIFDASAAPTVTTTTQSRVAGDTTVTVASGSGISNNDYLQWENEIVQVTAGGGTGTLTIIRAQKGTSAASHASGTGLVDINTSGNMLAKQSFSAVNVANGDSLQVTHKVQT